MATNWDAYEDFSKDKKKVFYFNNYSIKSKNLMVIQTNWWLVKWSMKQVVFQLNNLLDGSQRCVHS